MYFLTSGLIQSNRIPAPGRIWEDWVVSIDWCPPQPCTARAVITLILQISWFGEGKPGSYSECLVVQCEPSASGLGGPLLSRPSPRPLNIHSPGSSPSSSSLDPLTREKRLIRRYIGSTHAPPQLYLPLEGSCPRWPAAHQGLGLESRGAWQIELEVAADWLLLCGLQNLHKPHNLEELAPNMA